MMKALIVALFLSSPVLAQTQRDTRPPFAQRIDITEDDVVQGELPQGGGELVVPRRRTHQPSLIRLRAHFLPEMLKSVDSL